MSLVIENRNTLTPDDTLMLAQLAESVRLNGMDVGDAEVYDQNMAICPICAVCISCRCMVWTYH